MIEFNYELSFILSDENHYKNWLLEIITSENKTCGDLCFVFCADDYLLRLNNEHLQHDTYTDILTFDYCVDNEINGDVFISIERVRENSLTYKVSFDNELLRVLSHGVLHLCGFKDKAEKDILIMRSKEEEKIGLFSR